MNSLFIEEINLIHFGKFHNRSFKLKRGLNLIYGLNESGKTTVCDFIEGMFYGFDEGIVKRKYNDKFKRYNNGIYEGSITLYKNGVKYYIYRNFLTQELKVINLDENKQIELKKSDPNSCGQYFLDINYKVYRYLMMRNNDYTLKLDVRESVKTKLYNFTNTGSFDFDIDRALSILNKKLQKIGSDKAYTKSLYKLRHAVQEHEFEISRLKKLREQNSETFQKRNNILDKINKNLSEISEIKENKKIQNQLLIQENLVDIKQTKALMFRNYEKLKLLNDVSNLDSFDFKMVESLIGEKERTKKGNSKNNKFKNLNISLIFIFLLISVLISMFFKNWIYLAIILFYIPIKYFSTNVSNHKMKSDSSDNTQIKKYLNKLNVKNLKEFYEKKDRYHEFEKIKIEQDKLTERLQLLQKHIPQEKSHSDYKVELDFKPIINADKLLEEKEILQIKLNDSLIILEKKMAVIEEDLKKQVRLEEELESLKQKLDNIIEKQKALQLAIRTLEDLKSGHTAKKIRHFEDDINEIISTLTNDEYQKISLNDDMNPLVIDKHNKIIELEKLSVGMLNQLDFALKIILYNYLIKDKFIIFDDAFVNYDDKRLLKSLFFILDTSFYSQIIYLTSHTREKEMLDLNQIDFNYIDISVTEE